jgi:hypothetical protein
MRFRGANRMRIVAGILLLFATCLVSVAEPPKACGGFPALIGDWAGTGSGTPGQGQGGFTFHLDLQSRIIVRRSYAEYPATKDQPAYRHDDLMVLYNDADGVRRADYWDNEGHVIRYTLHSSDDECMITFESPKSANEPAYKLVYTFKSPDELEIAFQVAPAGKDFGDYIRASAKRKK